jgi:Transposase.
MGATLMFLQHYHDGEDFFEQNCHREETRVHYENQETKEKFRQWMDSLFLNKSKNFKQIISIRKCMATVFWNQKGFCFMKFMELGMTNTVASCSMTL